MFPIEVIDRAALYNDGVWQSVFRPGTLDPPIDEISPSPDFVFIICTADTKHIPELLLSRMSVIRIEDVKDLSKEDGSSNKDGLDQVAEMYGAKEIIRLSISARMFRNKLKWLTETPLSWWKRHLMVILRN
jgi:hypothetical protein